MPILTMKALLEDARKNKYAIIAANLITFEMIRGGIEAAEKNNSPLILQIAPVQFNTAPLEYIGPMLVKMAKDSSVPIAVHLDHGFDFDEIKMAIDMGFSSVMIDASRYSLEDNIKLTQRVVEYARKFNVTVEAELGYVGVEGGSSAKDGIQYALTDIKDAVKFVEQTNCDALAVAIGNAHGLYKIEPNLDFTRLSEINSAVNVPLVLHGGSGTSDRDFRKCIERGITKVNLASIIHNHYLKAMALADDDYVASISRLEKSTTDLIDNYIHVFESKNKKSNWEI